MRQLWEAGTFPQPAQVNRTPYTADNPHRTFIIGYFPAGYKHF